MMMVTYSLEQFEWNKAKNELTICSRNIRDEEWTDIVLEARPFTVISHVTGRSVKYGKKMLEFAPGSTWDYVLCKPLEIADMTLPAIKILPPL